MNKSSIYKMLNGRYVDLETIISVSEFMWSYSGNKYMFEIWCILQEKPISVYADLSVVDYPNRDKDKSTIELIKLRDELISKWRDFKNKNNGDTIRY